MSEIKNHEYTTRKTSVLIPYVNNSRTHSDEQVTQVASSIREFGFTNPVLIDEENGVIAGHGRLMAAKKLGIENVPCIILAGLSEAQKKAYVIADNQLALNSGWDMDMLKLEIESLEEMDFDIDLLGFDDDFFDEIEEEEEYLSDGVAGSMVENFIQPPFSILDTRKADWLERKRGWHERIKDKGESRQGTLGDVDSVLGGINSGVSILDPAMAEIIVTWFGTRGGVAFDPFSGDSVFGYVAGSLGMQFKGIELRKEQADLNQERVDDAGLPCKYFCDSGENMDAYIENESVDLVFTCPPYADLEVYSSDERDLSTMSHDNFFIVYKKILQGTFSKLKNNRFAVVVMGEVRNKAGEYIGTIPNTIKIMEEAGYIYYNEIIIINSAGTLPLRAGKSMRASRKVGKMHQNILVFLKGDAKQAVKYLGDIKVDETVVDDES